VILAIILKFWLILNKHACSARTFTPSCQKPHFCDTDFQTFFKQK
jgi:hypothetical protein